ncbi:uncharacterized protein LOC122090498 [Macadamia integrifolia]|uniref:uncharacterized protein LOC122090498 n=1 Tax=Macadamia integrifolia TaxID=60698 RepID=UPI001C4FAAD5|nr:uncharacterized protein LOC122090498 [Macadamia integrifolia]
MGMDISATIQIERKSSIESEPRTLNMNQLKFAREAALYVMQTRNIEEALSIFTKGLEPVVSAVNDRTNFTVESMEDYDNFTTQLRLSADVPRIRNDIASAPF